MSALSPKVLHPHVRRLILLVVGLLGLAMTAWLSGEVGRSEEDRLQQRFEVTARERGEWMIQALSEAQGEFAILQRFFHSVGEVDWPLFKDFVAPMISHQ